MEAAACDRKLAYTSKRKEEEEGDYGFRTMLKNEKNHFNLDDHGTETPPHPLFLQKQSNINMAACANKSETFVLE